MAKTYDIIIAGGGISGSMAAVSAARNGANVLIIEKEGYLGGMLTAGGVGPMMSFHAGSTQVIRGLTDELITRLKKAGKSPGHIFDTTGYVPTVTPFDSEAMKYELENMVTESGGDILYHTVLAGVKTKEKEIGKIIVCNKEGLTELCAKVFIDATGDADLSYWSGVECTKGREGDGLCQPMTLNMKMSNVDIDEIKRFAKENPEQFPRIEENVSIVDNSPRLSIGGFKGMFEKAVAEGEITFKRSNDILFFETNNKNEVIVNTTRVIKLDPTNANELTLAEIEGRRQVHELEKFLITRVPGFENAALVYSGPRIGVRSSRQIKGLYTITKEDLLSCRVFDDGVAISAYPIDIHPPEGIADSGSPDEFLPEDGRYSIPYRSMVNDRIDNLITVGRCISATYEAQGAIRTTPTVGAIGHAGGAAASIAAKLGIPARKVPFNELRRILEAQNAYLGY